MRFFTPEFYKSEQTPQEVRQVHQAYEQHLDAMQGILPAQVLSLAMLRGVDDGLIVKVTHDRTERVLTFTLRCGDLQMGYFDLVLTYRDADIELHDEWLLACLARTENGGGGALGLACRPDLAYHEVDQSEDGRILHRLLFHPGHWFTVGCRVLHWEKESRSDRILPALADRFAGGPTQPPSEAAS